MANKPKSLEYKTTFRQLKKNYPNADCALVHNNAFELLVATVLSAQCTDERVNKVTPILFKNFPTPHLMSQAKIADIEKYIHSTGFYKNKAKNIKSCSEMLVDKFNGDVPSSLEDLIQLPGVGRKTANVVLGVVYNTASGIVVDTHVGRLSKRFGWTKSKTAEHIEKDLIKLVPPKDWIIISHLLILHGRNFCQARKPLCNQCFLVEACPKLL